MSRPPMKAALRSAILDAHAEHADWGHRRIAAACGTSRDSVRRALRFAENIAAAAAGSSTATTAPAPAPASVRPPGTAETLSRSTPGMGPGPRRVAVSALQPLSDEDWRARPGGPDLLSPGWFPW